jgi:hypothetical protein
MLPVPNGVTIAWLTPHVDVVREGSRVAHSWEDLDGSCHFYFNVDGKGSFVLARSPEHLLEICDVVLRLLAASVVHSVTLHNWNYRGGAWINAASLAYLMEQCQSLKALILENLDSLNEDHLRVLGAYSRPDLECTGSL